MQGATDSLPWEGHGAGAGPSTAGGSALQPWGDAGGGATAGASGGRERSGNAEITPLEVLTPALPDSHEKGRARAQCLECVELVTTKHRRSKGLALGRRCTTNTCQAGRLACQAKKCMQISKRDSQSLS